MDTEKTLKLTDQTTEFSFEQLPDNEMKAAKYYVEITRHLQEIRHLYLMFQYCLDHIEGTYTLMSNGTILKDGKAAVAVEDFVAINAMVNSLISAGRTLVESMECYVCENYPKDSKVRKEYMDFYHDTYNGSFSYRFLIRMRDYSQHGHLPVNQNDEWFGFDLYQVLNKPHFKHNGQIKKQLEKSVQEVMDIYGDIPRLSLTMTLAEYAANLLSIYNKFWNIVETAMTDSAKAFSDLVAKHPENINFLGEGEKALFVYDVNEDGMAHAIPISDDACKMLSRFKKESEAVADRYLGAWDHLKERTMIIRVVDKKQIIIDTLG